MVVVYRTYTRVPHQRPVWRRARGDNVDSQDQALTDHEDDYASAANVDAAVEDQEALEHYDMDVEPSPPPAHKPIKQVSLPTISYTIHLSNSSTQSRNPTRR